MKKLERSNLSGAAYDAVKDALIGRTYAPGDRIAVEELSRALGVSRTPIWDAINRLEAEGMVEIVPRKGVYLLNFSEERARDIYKVREALEGMAARLAVEQLTEEHVAALRQSLRKQEKCLAAKDVSGYAEATIVFHNMIVAIAGNKILERLLHNLYGQMRALRLSTLYLPIRLKASFAEHEAIFAALLTREPSSAEEEARRHIRTTTADALALLAEKHSKADGVRSKAAGNSRTTEPVRRS